MNSRSGAWTLALDPSVREGGGPPAGELAVLSTPYSRERGPSRIHLFDDEGRVVGALPAAGGIMARLARGGDWLALDLSSRRGLLIRRSDGACLRFDFSEDAFGRSFFSPDGRELWRFAREPLRLLRYALPSPNDEREAR